MPVLNCENDNPARSEIAVAVPNTSKSTTQSSGIKFDLSSHSSICNSRYEVRIPSSSLAKQRWLIWFAALLPKSSHSPYLKWFERSGRLLAEFTKLSKFGMIISFDGNMTAINLLSFPNHQLHAPQQAPRTWWDWWCSESKIGRAAPATSKFDDRTNHTISLYSISII